MSSHGTDADDDGDELGALIYRSSQTARRFGMHSSEGARKPATAEMTSPRRRGKRERWASPAEKAPLPKRKRAKKHDIEAAAASTEGWVRRSARSSSVPVDYTATRVDPTTAGGGGRNQRRGKKEPDAGKAARRGVVVSRWTAPFRTSRTGGALDTGAKKGAKASAKKSVTAALKKSAPSRASKPRGSLESGTTKRAKSSTAKSATTSKKTARSVATTKKAAPSRASARVGTAKHAGASAKKGVAAPSRASNPRSLLDPSTKKNGRYPCVVAGCDNRRVQGDVCVRHGARKKQCRVEGCTNHAYNSGVCMRHGAKKKLCSKRGCQNVCVKSGVCVRHGAKPKHKLCKVEGCQTKVVRFGVCARHGANVTTCSHEGCDAMIRRKGGVCSKHRKGYTPDMFELDAKLRQVLDANGQSSSDAEAALLAVLRDIPTDVQTIEFPLATSRSKKFDDAKAKFTFRCRNCSLFNATKGVVVHPKNRKKWEEARDQAKAELRVLAELVAEYLPGEDKNSTKEILRNLIERRECERGLESRLRKALDAVGDKSPSNLAASLRTELNKIPTKVHAVELGSYSNKRYMKETSKESKFLLAGGAFWKGPAKGSVGVIVHADKSDMEEAKAQAQEEAQLLSRLFLEYFPGEGRDALKELLHKLLERRECTNDAEVVEVSV